MIYGQFDARGHIINDGLDEYGRPEAVMREVYRKEQEEREYKINRCATVEGGHFWKETTTPYNRALFDGTPLPSGKWHHFKCYCGAKKTIQDIKL